MSPISWVPPLTFFFHHHDLAGITCLFHRFRHSILHPSPHTFPFLSFLPSLASLSQTLWPAFLVAGQHNTHLPPILETVIGAGYNNTGLLRSATKLRRKQLHGGENLWQPLRTEHVPEIFSLFSPGISMDLTFKMFGFTQGSSATKADWSSCSVHAQPSPAVTAQGRQTLSSPHHWTLQCEATCPICHCKHRHNMATMSEF